MRSLLDKIEAEAQKYLRLSPEAAPEQELARCRRFLKVESHRLRMLHRAGANGLHICQARATVLDLMLRHVFQAVAARTPVDYSSSPLRLGLVALGGYGRGELNPQSDIDIMILHDGDSVRTAYGQPHPLLAALTNPGGLLYLLYDLGLKVGHSVRNIEDCVRIANTDMQSKTSMLEARLIEGDAALFQRFQAVVIAQCIRGNEDAYIQARLADQAARRAKHGNSACMQEPNIKNGCGGLRDYQNLLWMAFVKYRAHRLGDLEKRGLIGASERKQLESAYEFLLRVRNELHYHFERSADVLLRSAQPSIANNLGYTDRSPVVRIEKCMRDVYQHLRNIYLLTRTLEERLALLPQPDRRLPSLRQLIRRGRHRVKQQLVDGFKFVEGEVYPATSRVFRDQPRRLMRVFLHAQQRGLRLHPDTAHLVREQLSQVDRPFLRDPHVRETFLEILTQRGAVAPILRTMHEVGLLGKFLPEFGRLTVLVQHEFYHQYTADEHTLVCIEKLDGLWGATTPPLSEYAELFRQVERPCLLYLALLLHDAGKAYPKGDHAERGSRLALNVARRLALDPHTTQVLCLLTLQHLAMAQVSQRRDLDDPAVIRHFAALVKSEETLVLLTLLTYADATGTSDSLWNGFKDQLLWTLHRRARQLLAGGTEFIRAEAKIREHLATDVTRLLSGAMAPDEVQAHFDQLPARYFQIHNAAEIADDLGLVHQFLRRQTLDEERSLEPVVAWHNDPDRGYTTMKICTWDRAGLFSKIAGSLTASGLNIHGAQIFSRGDGIALDTFYVTQAQSGVLVSREDRERCERLLSSSLTTDLDLDVAIAKTKRGHARAPWEGERIPTTVRVDNDASDTRTVVEVQTEDKVGLLHAISAVFSDLSLDISAAKVCTENGAAIDTFYVQAQGGEKVLERDHLKILEQALRRAVARL